jgi:hypothetical protein
VQQHIALRRTGPRPPPPLRSTDEAVLSMSLDFLLATAVTHVAAFGLVRGAGGRRVSSEMEQSNFLMLAGRLEISCIDVDLGESVEWLGC